VLAPLIIGVVTFIAFLVWEGKVARLPIIPCELIFSIHICNYLSLYFSIHIQGQDVERNFHLHSIQVHLNCCS
jgi:hypothetical protein